MDVLDFILFPIYVWLIYLFLQFKKKNIDDPLLQKYFIRGYWVRVAGCIAFTIFNTYISQGDSIGLYQPEGAHISSLIIDDISNIKLLFTPVHDYDETLLFNPYNIPTLTTESNFIIVRISAIFSFVGFGKYFVNNLMFAMLAFAGTWRLYKFFYYQKPHLHKQLAIAILYFPTVIFWGSGAMKDPVCIAGIGFITYALYNLVVKKQGLLQNSAIILLFGYLLITTKLYIVVAYVPFFVLFLVLKNITLVKNSFVKYMLAPILIAGSVFAFTQIANRFDEELGSLAVNNISESVQTQRANFDAQTESGSNFRLSSGEGDASITGLILIAPAAAVATLFRPFLWESKKVSTLLSSLESLALMFFTLYALFKAGFVPFFQTLFKDPLAGYCISFALIFAIFVGASTTNFGSLVRYKIPCLPFYLITLYLILDVAEKRKQAAAPRIPQSSTGYL